MAAAEPTPQSQRTTLPSPEPFPCAPIMPRRSPGDYRIVNDEPVEDQPSTRRSGMLIKAT
ncbi:hypothetical protein BH11MYX4_BH11MYX4_43100 [soil metagenome]